MTQTIWIARHANRLDFVHPEWFDTAKRRYDPPLSEDGLVQAEQLAQRLKTESIQHIFASPFLRTVQTAHAVAEALDLPLKLEWGLCEWLNPDWMSDTPETAPPQELAQDYPRIDLSYTSRLQPQYPETDETCMRRAGEVAQLLAAEFPDNLLLVGHGASVLGTTWGLVPGKPEVKASLCCLVKVVWREEGWELELNGDTSHLDKTESTLRFN
ncbi:MAG: histidine phosphatase family protein [Desertifilum sp.]|nr:histidine phosphatase family protein [Desertifilum sp.]